MGMLDAIQSTEDQIQGGLDNAATSGRDNLLRDADSNLQKYNQANGKISTQDMSSKCPQCEAAKKAGQDINSLKVDPNSGTGTLSMGLGGGLSVIAGVDAETELSYKTQSVSGNYYYLDGNQHWIYVQAKHAKRGTGVEAKVQANESLDAGIKGKGSLSATEDGEISPSANAGLPK